jgi:hypothetical protein
MINDNYSIFDRISDAVSPVVRRLNDLQQGLYGTNTQILRIYRVVDPSYRQRNTLQNRSVLGDFKEKFEAKVIANVSIKYPFNNIEIFQYKNSQTQQTDVTGIDVSEILPIEAEILFEGDYDSDPISISLGDKLVDVFFDNNITPMPIILEVTKFFGNYFGKNIVSKKVNLSIHRGELNKQITDMVDEYIATLSARNTKEAFYRIVDFSVKI